MPAQAKNASTWSAIEAVTMSAKADWPGRMDNKMAEIKHFNRIRIRVQLIIANGKKKRINFNRVY